MALKIKKEKILKILVFLAIILIATLFRFWDLKHIPPGLYPDEAINGNEAITSPGKVFYKENNGREGLLINLLFLSFKIFGISVWSLRVVSAFFGVLTVIGIYFLAKELFFFFPGHKKELTAFLSCYFLAVSFWHTIFSRIGFRGVLLPFVLTFSFYFIFKGLRKGSFFNLILGGVFFGLGFYTYTPFRLSVFLLFWVIFAWYLIYKEKFLKRKFVTLVSVLLFSIFCVGLPIGIYFLENPQDFSSRVKGILVFSQPHPLKAFLKSVVLHLGMFNFFGDGNWRHNMAGSPQLYFIVGIFFLMGVFFSIYSLLKQLTKEKLLSFGTLFVWFGFLLLPSILTYEGIPHCLRSIGVIPPVYVFASLGVVEFYERIKKFLSFKMFVVVLVIMVLFIGWQQYIKYFEAWGKKEEVKNAFSKDFVDLGEKINSLPDEIPKYVIVNVPGVPVPYPNGIPMPAQTVMFIERTKYKMCRAKYILPEDLKKIKIEKNAVVFSMKK